MPVEVPKILDIASQRTAIASTTDLPAYESFTEIFFTNNAPNQRWLNFLKVELSNPDYENMPPDYFRLLGLVGIIFSQAGFSSLEGQIGRHRNKGFKKSPIDPRHQLALACYGGDINTQAYPIRRRWSRQIAKSDPDEAPGVWGINIEVISGQLADRFKKRQLMWVKMDAGSRIASSTPVCLPNKGLNKKLSEIGFTGDDAEKISDKQFEEEILPKAQKAVSGYVDLEQIFHR